MREATPMAAGWAGGPPLRGDSRHLDADPPRTRRAIMSGTLRGAAAAQPASAVPPTSAPAVDSAHRDALSLADWRREVSALYARVRAQADPRAAWTLWRATRDALFAEHPQSPLPATARHRSRGLPHYAYDPALRFAVRTEPHPPAQPLEVPVGADGRLVLLPALRTVGLARALGGELTVYSLGGYGGGLFLPFRDATAGKDTYGGGRYLLDTIKGADLGSEGARLALDFNFAYNPSCAYNARWTCPLAPAANALPRPVRAGERAPGR